MTEIQDSSALDHEQRVLQLISTRVPYPNLLRAPPGHMKDLVVLWDHIPVSGLELGESVVSKGIEQAKLRAIPKQQLDPIAIRSWLMECENDHGEKRYTAAQRSFSSEQEI